MINTFEKTKSIAKPFEQINNLQQEIKQYDYVLAIYTDKVKVSYACDFEQSDNLLELRAFNTDKELHLVKVGADWRGRVRSDVEGEETEYFEQKQLVWGKSEGSHGGTSVFHEDRGIDIELPVSSEKGDRAFLEIRNYLDHDKFEFTDYRICGITTGKVGDK